MSNLEANLVTDSLPEPGQNGPSLESAAQSTVNASLESTTEVPPETAKKASIQDVEVDVAELWNIPEFTGLAAVNHSAGSSGQAETSRDTKTSAEGEKRQEAQIKKGFEQGFAEGMQAAQKQSAERQRQFDELFSIFETPLKQLDQRIGADLMQLATGLAEALVRQQLTLAPRLIEPLIEDALSALEETHETASICLSPQDHSALSVYLAEKQSGELAKQFGSQYRGDLRLEISAELNSGDIQVKTKNARVEASLEKRFKQIFEVLINCDSALASSAAPSFELPTDSQLDSALSSQPNSKAIPKANPESGTEAREEGARH